MQTQEHSVQLIVQSVRLMARMGLDGCVQSVPLAWAGLVSPRKPGLDWTDCRRLDGLLIITCFARFHAIYLYYTQRENDQNLSTVYKVEYAYCKSTSHSAASISSIALISSLVAATSPSRPAVSSRASSPMLQRQRDSVIFAPLNTRSGSALIAGILTYSSAIRDRSFQWGSEYLEAQ